VAGPYPATTSMRPVRKVRHARKEQSLDHIVPKSICWELNMPMLILDCRNFQLAHGTRPPPPVDRRPLYFKGPEGFTYEYSWGVRRIEDEASWRPRTFDPTEPDAIDMWRGTTQMPTAQPQLDRALGE
jgi:hypothetical protein